MTGSGPCSRPFSGVGRAAGAFADGFAHGTWGYPGDVSLDAVTSVLREIRDSGSFAAQLAEDPAVLTGYDLTPQEREALLSEDEEELLRLGVPAELVSAVRGVGRPGR